MKSRLLLISGHGGADPGTVAGDLIERDVNVNVVLSANDYMGKTYQLGGTRVDVFTYTDRAPVDADSGLAAKIATANAAGADALVVEVHQNAQAAEPGAQVWVSQRANDKPGDETGIAAPIFARELAALAGVQLVPILSSDRSRFGKLGILDDVVGTALLLECRNLADMGSPDYRYRAGAAIARACAAYFGWSVRDVVELLGVLDALIATAQRARELAQRGG